MVTIINTEKRSGTYKKGSGTYKKGSGTYKKGKWHLQKREVAFTKKNGGHSQNRPISVDFVSPDKSRPKNKQKRPIFKFFLEK